MDLHDLWVQWTQANEPPLRHMCLRATVAWLRGSDGQVSQVLARLDRLLQALQSDAALRQRVQGQWQAIEEDLELASVLADFGFAARGKRWVHGPAWCCGPWGIASVRSVPVAFGPTCASACRRRRGPAAASISWP